MKKIWYLLSLCVVLMLSVVPSSNGQAINKIIGITGQCDKALAGCAPFPLSAILACISAATFCPDTFHPSWVDGNRLWGFRNNGSGTAPTCVTSTDLGTNWVACTTQPWVGTTFPQIASASDGSLVTLADDPSLVAFDCTIKRSIDNGVSWAVVFVSTVPFISCNHSGMSQTMYCQPTGGQCDAGNTRFGTTTRVFRSADNGANWSSIDVSTTNANVLGGIVFNGTQGVFSTDFIANDVVALSTSNTWISSAVWAATASYQTIRMGFLFGGTSPQLITQSTGTLGVFHRVDTIGTSLQQMTPPLIRAAAASRLQALYWGGSMYYVTYPPTAGGGVGLIVAITGDNFGSFNVIYTDNSNFSSDRVTIYKHNGKVLISLVGGGFIRVS